MALFLAMTGCKQQAASVDDIKEVPFTATHITDGFWAPRIEVNRTVTIPAALYQCDINGRFDNFAIAGGLKEGEHRGDFSFDDTDPYKVIEGASYSLAAHYDAALDKRLDSLIAIIASAQEPDGYLTTCVTNKCYRLSGWWGTSKWEKINSHELYNSGHLIEAAVAHYQATGKRNFLDVAIKNADLVCKTFGPDEGQIHRPSGHPIAEMALAKLYKVTGDEKYLKTAKYFVEETGRGTDGHKLSAYSQDHKPILEQDEIVGHAVRAGYLYSGVADVAALTHDKAYFDALSRIWDNMAGCKLYITGGIGSRPQGEGFGPNYELHNMVNYCETCASIANVYWNHRMFLYTGDSKYMDVLELALYNGVLSGVSLSGDRFFYDNPLESMGQHYREKWFGCACCPGNVTRFMASVPNYMYATRGNDIYVNLYIGSETELETASGKVALSQSTKYPWDGVTEISVNPASEGKFKIYVRIPGWAREAPVATDLYAFTDAAKPYSVSVNGEAVNGSLKDGYIVIDRAWKAGDKVQVSLPMDVRRVQANENVEDDLGKLAIMRGPVVYCLEGVDQENGQVFDKYIKGDAAFEASFDEGLLGGVEVLQTQAISVGLDGTETPVSVKAIPYSTWCNRGSDEMAVWIPVDKEITHPKPEPTIASRATIFTEGSVAAIQNDAPALSPEERGWAWGTNDQWEPKRSSDISKPYHYWWLKFGCEVNLGYEFAEMTEVKDVEVYWLDFDHYDGDFRVPASWKLYYQDASGKWQECTAYDEYGTEKDCYNTVHIKPVKTKAINIVAQLQEGKSGGIIEWKVNEAKSGLSEGGYPYSPVPFTAVNVTDKFWGQRLKASREVTIPLAFSKCEETGRYENFIKAAHPSEEYEVKGYTFDDTDVYKTIEGASYVLQLYPDEKLEKYIDSVLVIVAGAQEPDGYLYTSRTMNPKHPHEWAGPTRWSKVEELSHEFYNLGHMVDGAVAHYQATGKTNFLDIAKKYADCVCREIGPKAGQLIRVPGHQIAEMALCRLYLVTGDKKYLDQAKFFLDYRGKTSFREEYNQTHLPVLEQDEAVGHAVRAAYLYAGMADVAALTGDRDYIEAIDRIWENIVYKKLYITGGIGATNNGEAFGENYELPNMSAYCETCAAIGNVYVNHRMFLLHGDAKYYDVLERSLYNGLISGVSLEGDGFFYPNPLESIGQHQRQAWFGCACCPSNICRFIPSVPGYIYAVKDNSLYVNLFMANTATSQLANGAVTVSQETSYPWSGDVKIKIDENKAGNFALRLRIPGWVRGEVVPSDLYSYKDGKRLGYTVSVNGEEVTGDLYKGYFTIRRDWKAGDEVELHLDMEPRVVKANPEVEADQGRVAIEKGPVVYCAEWPDNDFSVRSILMNQAPKMKVEHKDNLLYGIDEIISDAQTLSFNEQGQVVAKNVKLTMIPYYAWCHRGSGEMIVWIPQELRATTPSQPETLSSQSKVQASTMTSAISAINDRLVPKHSEDRSVPYYHWWPKQGGTEWLEYDFPKATKVSSSTVYWFDDQPWGGCSVPQAWRIYYKDKNGQWQEVEGADKYTLNKGVANDVNFKPVTTTAVKLEVDQPAEYSCGLFEWEIK